ncbi:peptidoglycan recognition protein family protein [Mycobacteroides abscessus]|uniref:peptidoglycan recognition protein family protein n=1 Tax=Mycobacteroides abscessus TaxID=36809 RepID=UPI00092855B4|nr:peptidoglycan recognition family protein [Mycobacteroides abscessus]DAZ90363.1 TPA_asm: lysin A [Mycobacterium phage prophiFSQJ01-1]SII41696.1 peptidoglycan-binding domain 1 protein [Mycobacteroides abscessus subsp. abscessus]SIK13434.1 peptidoglycan-binding domain 1 protein [Mycobacteroides abscessus subsp. abscessus]SIN25796.1 peptidoglycan-binding domain 1 protein [Mycobacteroides abscessus subsp. abscessus]SLI51152.1 peptidoglycan-binding domain 1 protein [Mycobacteroides abscessus subs
MSFVWLADKPLRSREEIAQIVHAVSLARGLDELASAMVLMCIDVEVGANDRNGKRQWWCPWNAKDPSSQKFPHDSESNDGRSVGYFQQQNGRAGEVLPVDDRDNWWGSMTSRMTLALAADTFLDRLSDDYRGAADNPALAGQFVQRVQGSAFPDRYAQSWNEAWSVLRRALDGTTEPSEPGVLTPTPGFSGDPFWLADVLRAEGLNVVEMDGWRERGEGDQGVLWGAVFHHTGNVNETPEGIAFHPDLGLAAHLLIRPDGTVWVCGIGMANHAGVGSWPGIRTDNANPVTIGVEVAILPEKDAPHRTGWPAVQYDATVKTFAAILRKLALGSDRAISHKEWAQLGPAGYRQGKWDPGAIDMNIFRADVQAQIGSNTGGFLMALSDTEQREILSFVREMKTQVASLSPFRHLGEEAANNIPGFVRVIDANSHVEIVEKLAGYGDQGALALLHEIADADLERYPDRRNDAELARRVLAKVAK